MITTVFISLFMTLGAQPAGAPAPLVAQLCNETPARVAFTVSYPSGARSERRRGWLVVEPGACSGGSIGQTTGGTAHAHAMSGGLAWPDADTGARRCAPASSHDSMAARPPCPDGERAFSVTPVTLEDRGNHFRLNHTVSCADLSAVEQRVCDSGRTDQQGFAEPVRRLEVCNRDRGAVAMAIAGEALDGSVQVVGWIGVPPGACRIAWSGLTRQGVVYAHTRGSGQAVSGSDYRQFCVTPGQAFDRRAASPDAETDCPEGLEARPFRPVRFAPNVTRMTLDIEPS